LPPSGTVKITHRRFPFGAKPIKNIERVIAAVE
jgi:hypothetical protein